MNVSITEDETIISSAGEGWTPRVLIGFTSGAILTLIGAVITLAFLLGAIAKALDASWHDSLLLLFFSPLPLCAGCVFLLHYFRLGWNETILTLTENQMAVSHNGNFRPQPYRVPLSEIDQLHVATRFGERGLDVRLRRLWANDRRRIFHRGTKKELDRIEDLVRSKLEGKG